MELRKRIDLRYVFIGVYILAFLVYIIYGLRPIDAVHSEGISGSIEIPAIGLSSGVTRIELEGNKLPTPEKIVGSYSSNPNNTLLIGHEATIFKDLKNVELGDKVVYDDSTYKVNDIRIIEKDQINMRDVLAEKDETTLSIMTCAGTSLGGGDATHRLIVTAVQE